MEVLKIPTQIITPKMKDRSLKKGEKIRISYTNQKKIIEAEEQKMKISGAIPISETIELMDRSRYRKLEKKIKREVTIDKYRVRDVV